jgi:hypothetical protein
MHDRIDGSMRSETCAKTVCSKVFGVCSRTLVSNHVHDPSSTGYRILEWSNLILECAGCNIYRGVGGWKSGVLCSTFSIHLTTYFYRLRPRPATPRAPTPRGCVRGGGGVREWGERGEEG